MSGSLLADRPAGRRGPSARTTRRQAQPDRPPPHLAALAQRLYRERRDREKHLGRSAHLFGEPAWDILLDLFVAMAQGKRVAVSSACIASAVPMTTALRWLDSLRDAGLVIRQPDPADARRAFVALTPRAVRAIQDYLEGCLEMR